MSRRPSPTLVGAFVVGGLVLAIATVLVFGGVGFLVERPRYIFYFSGSVEGLEVGAPVRIRGVRVGSVVEVQAVYDREAREFRIPVIAELYPEAIRGTELEEGGQERIFRYLIEKLGLRARLQMQSFVTGLLYIQLDYYPGTPIVYRGEGDLPEIPTVPTSIEQLEKGLQEFPIEEVLQDISSTMDAIARFVNEPELMETVRSLRRVLGELDALVGKIDRKVDPLSTETVAALQSIQETSEQTRKTMASVEALLSDDSLLVYNVNVAVNEITEAARSLRELADLLERQPEALIRGRNPDGGDR